MVDIKFVNKLWIIPSFPRLVSTRAQLNLTLSAHIAFACFNEPALIKGSLDKA